MFCCHCGNAIPCEGKFCAFCGKALESVVGSEDANGGNDKMMNKFKVNETPVKLKTLAHHTLLTILYYHIIIKNNNKYNNNFTLQHPLSYCNYPKHLPNYLVTGVKVHFLHIRNILCIHFLHC